MEMNISHSGKSFLLERVKYYRWIGGLYYNMKEVVDTCIDSGLGETHQRTRQPYWESDDRAGAGRTRPFNASYVEKATGLRYEIKVMN
jgi:hypothetical protein